MNKLILTLIAAASLTTTAVMAQAADIQIAALPFNITAPGTYVLTGNLSFTGSTSAISITGPFSEPVVLNLKGYTLTGEPGVTPIGVSVGGNAPNISSITIENGTITNFVSGVSVVPANGFAGSSPTNFFSSIKIDNLVVNGGGNPQGTGACVFFEQVNSSIISNCSFNANDYGIRDFLSTGGNRYFNVSFTRCGQLLFVDTVGGNGILEHCDF